MIARDSKSYPYLSIAQHYNISYAEVLHYADLCKKYIIKSPFQEWRLEIWLLENSNNITQ